VRYQIMAKTYRDLEAASGRLELIRLLADLVRQTPDELLPTVALLCQGQIAPDFAGPPSTEPSSSENVLWWQVHVMALLSILDTRQPWCVQTALKALKSPSAGWVMTTFSSWKILPLPTGMSLVLIDVPPCWPPCVWPPALV
jgi:hypothetical protein